jgi:hypothetical protein
VAGIALAAGALFAFQGPANAVLLQFSVDTIQMRTNPGPPYTFFFPTGTFDFDTETEAVSNVAVSTLAQSFSAGVYNTVSGANFHLTGSGSEYLDIYVDEASILALHTAGGPVSGLTIVQDTIEYASPPPANFISAYNGGDLGVELAPATETPVVAPLSFILAGVAGVAGLRRRRG